MKILVCGGRDYGDAEKVEQILNAIHENEPITFLVHGGASGADTLAWDWAVSHGVEWRAYNPDWAGHGKSAGPRRNQLMLTENPDIKLVVAFPGGKGTADMVQRAAASKIPITKVK